ncbi:MAG: putative potassium transport system protein kup 1 [Candidatus Binatia bacterium]|nr:MAG: putative potassium transport system protein kup 1 [Candidatus Binatia bacterium]
MADTGTEQSAAVAGGSVTGFKEEGQRSPVLGLALAALGVVFGDIGTSPLYAVRECFIGPHAVPISPHNVIGVLSLVFWSLTVVISVKYLVFVMRADNEGEGGILALLALVMPKETRVAFRRTVLIACGLFGAALLYGDGIITPAISVLSAVEGLNVATHAFEPYVVPIAAAILLLLFAVQRHGTGGLGAVFGPAMLVWFFVIGALGLRAILLQPHGEVGVWEALNPWHGIEFFARNGLQGFLVLGSVVLCITGGEALYADMGHFGRRPIRLAWYGLVFPALLLNYFGQGALLLAEGGKVTHPFFELAPAWMLYPLVGLATLATIIASQALISGAFSLTHQASQLGYLPRFNIIHTSEEQAGQIYIPQVNVALGALCLLLVLGFQSSSALAGAYGLAVTGTMTATTLLFYAVTRELWSWSLAAAVAAASLFLLFDLAFLLANLPKLPHGGWFALAVGIVVFTILTTWKRGRTEVAALLERASLSEEAFLADVENQKVVRVDGTAVVMTSTPRGIPAVLLHYVKHTKTLHKRVVLLSILTEKRPEVPDKEKIEVKELGSGFYRIIAHFGFMEVPRIRHVLRLCQAKGLAFDLMTTTFFLGRETLLPTGRARMAKWRKRLYILLARNAPSAAAFFEIPVNRVVELGAQLEL